MNVERLFTVAMAIKEDMDSSGIINMLSQINSTLNTIIKQPNNGPQLEQLTVFLNKLKDSCSSSKYNDFPPLWRQATAEIGIDLLGLELFEYVNNVIQENQLTVPEAKTGIESVLNNLNSRLQSLNKMIESFEQLDISSEDLKEGECEIGILIPRQFVDNDLKNIAGEFEKLGETFAVFEEIANGTRSGFKVNSLSSTDFGLYLAAAPPLLLLLSQAIDKLMSAYKNYWEVKKIKQELEEKKNVPASSLEGLETHIKKIVHDSIEESIKEIILKAHPSIDGPRKNELKNELKVSLNKIANRLDRGFNIELRIAAPEDLEEDDQEDAESQEELSHEMQMYQQIKSNCKSFTYIENDGEPVVCLPESIEEIKGSVENPNKKKKTTKKKTH
jgi:hypothetical protein